MLNLSTTSFEAMPPLDFTYITYRPKLICYFQKAVLTCIYLNVELGCIKHKNSAMRYIFTYTVDARHGQQCMQLMIYATNQAGGNLYPVLQANSLLD